MGQSPCSRRCGLTWTDRKSKASVEVNGLAGALINVIHSYRLLQIGVLACSVALAGSISLAQAQQGRPAQAPAPAPVTTPAPVPVPAEPQATTAAFGDWLVRCGRDGEGATVRRICEVAQTIQVQGQQGPLAQIAIGRVNRADPLRITIVLPTNVSFPSTVSIGTEPDKNIADLAWRRCVPGACIADVELQIPVLQQLRGRADTGRMTFKDASGRDIVLPLSLRGLAQALDALAKEP